MPEEAREILRLGLVAHVGFCESGQPYVIPFSYHYDPARPDRLYLHGAQSSRALRELARGGPVCVTVTLLDGLVYSRTAKYHSMNYRSVVCFGRARRLPSEADKAVLSEGLVARYFPGRASGRDYDAPPPAHLRATAFVEVQIERWSAKARRGGPTGPRDEADAQDGTTRGVTELTDSAAGA